MSRKGEGRPGKIKGNNRKRTCQFTHTLIHAERDRKKKKDCAMRVAERYCIEYPFLTSTFIPSWLDKATYHKSQRISNSMIYTFIYIRQHSFGNGKKQWHSILSSSAFCREQLHFSNPIRLFSKRVGVTYRSSVTSGRPKERTFRLTYKRAIVPHCRRNAPRLDPSVS